MTPEELRGRRTTMVIALVVGVPPLLTLVVLLLLRQPGSDIPWVQSLIPVALSVLLLKGYRWARAYIIFSLFAASLLLLLGALFAGSLVLAIATAIVTLPFAVAYVICAIILWRSKAVEAYFDRQTYARDALPSLKDQDGV
jgi:hypothetical protein